MLKKAKKMAMGVAKAGAAAIAPAKPAIAKEVGKAAAKGASVMAGFGAAARKIGRMGTSDGYMKMGKSAIKSVPAPKGKGLMKLEKKVVKKVKKI